MKNTIVGVVGVVGVVGSVGCVGGDILVPSLKSTPYVNTERFSKPLQKTMATPLQFPQITL